MEECAVGMEQRLNDAAKKDAQVRFGKKECALSMGQSSNYVATKGVQILSSEEECAVGMGHIAIQMMNPLHLDQNSK